MTVGTTSPPTVNCQAYQTTLDDWLYDTGANLAGEVLS